MKAKTFFSCMLIALMAATVPATAQTHKDKKAAKKAQWEMEQQQQREEAELRHQIKMDSLKNAGKVAEQQAAKEEAERRTAEKEAAAKAKKAEEAAALQEVEFNEPCMEFESTPELIRARGIGEDYEQQLSVEMARSAAIEELGEQISTHVQALMTDYKKSQRKNLSRESLRRVEGMTLTEVDQATGYRIACRKTTTYVQNGERIFKTYIVVELDADKLLKPIYQGIQADDELRINDDYENFKNEFNEHFSDAQ